MWVCCGWLVGVGLLGLVCGVDKLMWVVMVCWSS